MPDNFPPRIILIGYMGSGKSTLGRKIAHRLGYPFFDTDKLIEDIEKQSIREIFSTKGEEYFRKRESDLLQRYSFPDEAIISTGGGLPCYGNNMQKLKEIGTTVYLQLNEQTLCDRLMQNKSKRPATVDKSKEEIQQQVKSQLSQRKLFYEQANFIINGLGLDAEKLLLFLKNVEHAFRFQEKNNGIKIADTVSNN